MQSLEARLPHGDHNVGTVYLPDGPAARGPVVVYCHGWGDDRTLRPVQAALAEALTRRGAALVQFDFYGAGSTGGDFSAMSYGRWTANLAAVFEWAQAQPWADPARIALIGFSSGTTAALRFAAQDRRPLCVISLATCLGHFINMASGGGPARVMLGHLEHLQAGGSAPVFDTPFPLSFFQDFLVDAPVHTVQDVACPVFFLEGTADNPYRRTDGWLGHLIRQRHGKPSRHHEVEGGEHGLFNKGEERNALIVGYLQERGFF